MESLRPAAALMSGTKVQAADAQVISWLAFSRVVRSNAAFVSFKGSTAPAKALAPTAPTSRARLVHQPGRGGRRRLNGVGVRVWAAREDRLMDGAPHCLVLDWHALHVERPATLATPSRWCSLVAPRLGVPGAFSAQPHDCTTFLGMGSNAG